MRKRLSIARVLVVCVLAVALASCGGRALQEEGPTGGAETQGAAVAATERVVSDAYGREVVVPAEVERVATVGSGARFVVYAGAQDKLVAVTEMETEPSLSRPYTMAYESLFASLPSTSNGNHLLETEVNTEELLALDPQVIVSSRSAEECDDLQVTTGIPVVGIRYQNQLFSDDVYGSIMAVAEACGTTGHAEGVVSAMHVWKEDLDTRVARVVDRSVPTVYVGAVNYKGARSFGGTCANYAPLMVLGATNVADETGEQAAFDVDLEQLGVWDPDYMFLNAGNMELMRDDYEANRKFLDALGAFREAHLFTQPSYNMNGTNVDMGICDTYFIGATIWPEVFADLDLDARYAEVFETMLGIDFYATMREAGMGFDRLSFS